MKVTLIETQLLSEYVIRTFAVEKVQQPAEFCSITKICLLETQASVISNPFVGIGAPTDPIRSFKELYQQLWVLQYFFKGNFKPLTLEL